MCAACTEARGEIVDTTRDSRPENDNEVARLAVDQSAAATAAS